MSSYTIIGGKRLVGEVEVAGNKNAVLPIMAACILVHGTVTLENVPRIKDVFSMGELLTHLGAKVSGLGEKTITINTKNIHITDIPADLASKLRASVLLLGPLLARFKKVSLPYPGGDVIGKRSIDTHLDAFKILGASITDTGSEYKILLKDINFTSNVLLNEMSVTATENMLMFLAYQKSQVSIQNCALEPHVQDLTYFLKSTGVYVYGIGSHNVTVEGSVNLKAVTYTISPDYLEAGTFAVISAITGGDILIKNCNPGDLLLPLFHLRQMGVAIKQGKDTIQVTAPSKLTSTANRIQALPHPGFPTDLMSQFIVLGTQTKGQTLYHDPLYESRMFFVDKLIRMGAHITICDPHRVIVYGPNKLLGRNLESPDIRAGVALVIAGLVAEGKSIIYNAEIIERGYENLEERLRLLGAEISRT